jgi:hypothetical protein
MLIGLLDFVLTSRQVGFGVSKALDEAILGALGLCVLRHVVDLVSNKAANRGRVAFPCKSIAAPRYICSDKAQTANSVYKNLRATAR